MARIFPKDIHRGDLRDVLERCGEREALTVADALLECGLVSGLDVFSVYGEAGRRLVLPTKRIMVRPPDEGGHVTEAAPAAAVKPACPASQQPCGSERCWEMGACRRTGEVLDLIPLSTSG